MPDRIRIGRKNSQKSDGCKERIRRVNVQGWYLFSVGQASLPIGVNLGAVKLEMGQRMVSEIS